MSIQDIKYNVSTKMYIVCTNIFFDTNKIYDFLPLVEYKVRKKRRGRKKNGYIPEKKQVVTDGSIIYIQNKEKQKGCYVKNKYFRNSLSIIMVHNLNHINIKINTTGNLQVTGCKNESSIEYCIRKLWSILRTENDLYKFKDENDNTIKITYIPYMCNIDFNLNYSIDRIKLDRYFNLNTSYPSIFESNIGHTGVNIKFPLKDDIRSMKIRYEEINKQNYITLQKTINYSDYLATLDKEKVKTKLSKKRFCTFLTFHSGKVIMSGMDIQLMEKSLIEFYNIMQTIKDKIVQKIQN